MYRDQHIRSDSTYVGKIDIVVDPLRGNNWKRAQRFVLFHETLPQQGDCHALFSFGFS